MRTIIVSKEVPTVAGTIEDLPAAGDRKRLVKELISRLNRKNVTVGIRNAVLKSISFPGFYAAFETSMDVAEQLGEAVNAGFELGLRHRKSQAASRDVLGVAYRDDWMEHRLDFEEKCLTIGSGGLRGFFSHQAPVFLGHFPKPTQFSGLLQQGGGTSRIHIFNNGVARECFQRHGGGILEDGLYLLHPKRNDVLVPFDGFHQTMLEEMTREVRVVLGRIGAKHLQVEAIEGMSFAGRIVSRHPAAPVAVQANFERTDERTLNYEWGSMTYEPERALEDCVWIRDNAGVMTIVDQRRTSNLTGFEEISRADTSFGVSVDVMKIFESGFEWKKESRYRYKVEFFDRPETK